MQWKNTLDSVGCFECFFTKYSMSNHISLKQQLRYYRRWYISHTPNNNILCDQKLACSISLLISSQKVCLCFISELIYHLQTNSYMCLQEAAHSLQFQQSLPLFLRHAFVWEKTLRINYLSNNSLCYSYIQLDLMEIFTEVKCFRFVLRSLNNLGWGPSVSREQKTWRGPFHI